jgi:uncharacterized membrane protein YtjA (UPF0391 family)
MLNWALTFLVIAIIAAVFGFGGIAATATGIAQILFYIFLVLFLERNKPWVMRGSA